MPSDRPRFRRDLVAVPTTVDEQSYVEVSDPVSGTSFSFYDFEYRVALAFDGLPLEKVAPWVKLSTGMELNVDQLRAFAAQLAEMGFLEPEAEISGEPAEPGAEAHGEAREPVEPGAEPDGDAEGTLPPAPDQVSMDDIEPLAEARPEVAEVAESPTDAAAASASPESPTADVVHRPALGTTADSTAFPVLPVSGERAPAPSVPLPPSSSPPWMTPAPVTFGPTLLAEDRQTPRRLRRSIILFGSLGVLAATAVVAIVLPFLLKPRLPPVVDVKTVVATPKTVLRYHAGSATVLPIAGAVLKMPAPGKVIRTVAAGASVEPGDVLVAVDKARPLLAQLTKHRERLAFYRQIADGLRAEATDPTQLEKAAAKLQARRDWLGQTLRDLARYAIVADAPAIVDEVLVKEGEVVVAESPGVRLRSPGYEVSFEMRRADAGQARRKSLCLADIGGYVFDCAFADTRSDETHVVVDLPGAADTVAGKPARLVRARYENAFVLPAVAVRHSESRDEVALVGAASRVELRRVTVAERNDTDVVVVQGLDAGERIIVEPALALRPGTQVGLAD